MYFLFENKHFRKIQKIVVSLTDSTGSVNFSQLAQNKNKFILEDLHFTQTCKTWINKLQPSGQLRERMYAKSTILTFVEMLVNFSLNRNSCIIYLNTHVVYTRL